MGEDVYINLLNPDQEKCLWGTCAANLTNLDGTAFHGNSWLQDSGHKLNVQAGQSCLKLEYAEPSKITNDPCTSSMKYICEFNCDWGKIWTGVV